MTESSLARRALTVLGRPALFLAVAVLGFVLGVFALYVAWVRSGPPLEIWHTEELTGEFTAEDVDEIRTFDGYLRLEERLFARLDEEIYEQSETGPAFVLARYSRDSAADPKRWEPDWNRSFELPVEEPAGGVLLLHGMSDSPYSLRALGQTLHDRGYWVVGLRLPGHGTVPSGLLSVRWEDMAAAVRLAVDHLASKVGPDSIHIAGYSTGAPLAIDYTLGAMEGDERAVPASLVLISPAIGISRVATLAKWNRRLAVLPGLEKFNWSSILPEFDPFKYNSFAINAGDQVHRLTRTVAAAVETLAASGAIEDFPPTLVFLSTVDATVSVDDVIDNLLEHLAAEHHELVLFDINRRSAISTVLVSDPGPLTTRLIATETLPFGLTLITNEGDESPALVAHGKGPFSTEISTRPLELEWPRGAISLSHVALPFPPDDPVYGANPPETEERIFLGRIAIRGERGLLKIPESFLLRLRHNPFYTLLESRVVEWVEGSDERRGFLRHSDAE